MGKITTNVRKKRSAAVPSKAKEVFADLSSGKPASYARSLALAVELIATVDDAEAILVDARNFVASAASAAHALREIKRLSVRPRKRLPRATTTVGSMALLTASQQRVYVLLLEGVIERNIADRLGISIHTVHNHAKEIYRRLSVSTRGELVARWARENGARIGEVP